MQNEFTTKLIGATVLLLSAAYFSYIKISASRRRLIEVSAFKDMIKDIRDNIEHFSRPIPDILKDYRNDYFEGNGLSLSIRTHGIKEAINKYNFVVDDITKEVLLKFFNKIGTGYKNDEITLCAYTLEKLSDLENSVIRDNKNKEKLYRSIPITLALSVILLLI